MLYFITELNEKLFTCMIVDEPTNSRASMVFHGYIATLSSPTHVYMTSASASFEFLFFADQALQSTVSTADLWNKELLGSEDRVLWWQKSIFSASVDSVSMVSGCSETHMA